ncbi:MAG: Mor transcription activator family protein [Desulfovibrio sp.]|uniref:Mor transcription activator family protein n=1 Tax=Desulfovibrio sp. 7SRBS1 TaxID=3378064 RepID=UPI003B3E3586
MPQQHGATSSFCSASSTNWEALPRLCRDLRDLVGEHSARHVLNALGGQVFYIPRIPPPDHPLAAIRPEAAQRICNAFHGERLAIPQARWLQRQERDNAIRLARKSGQSVSRLACVFGLSRRRIQQILASGQETEQ